MILRIYKLWLKLTHSSKCQIEECAKCGVRDCPFNAMEHYWHDGCPICYTISDDYYKVSNDSNM